MSELKACPFCRCEMRIESNRDWHRLWGDHGPVCFFQDNEPTSDGWPATDEARAELIAFWNTRPAPTEGECPVIDLRGSGMLLNAKITGKVRVLADQPRSIDGCVFIGKYTQKPGVIEPVRMARPAPTDAEVEAAARRMLLVAQQQIPGAVPIEWDDLGENHRNTYRRMARAALGVGS